MPNTKKPHSQRNVFAHQTNHTKNQKLHGAVWQDKERSSRARIASQQPAPLKKAMRPHPMISNTSRSQNKPTPKRKTVHLTLWVKPIVKEELQRISEREGVSVSAAGGAFLERALQQSADMQYSALLTPIIETAIAKQMRAISTRLAWLLVRVAYDGGQTRSLVTNILGRQPGVTPEILQTILEGSGKTAKANITRRTPQITQLIEAVEQWIVEEDGKERAARG